MKEKTQVIGVRIPNYLWHSFEIKCIEDNITMSDVLRYAIQMYMADKLQIPNINEIKYDIKKATENLEFKDYLSFIDGIEWYKERLLETKKVSPGQSILSDLQIELFAKHDYDGWIEESFINGAKWYRDKTYKPQFI